MSPHRRGPSFSTYKDSPTRTSLRVETAIDLALPEHRWTSSPSDPTEHHREASHDSIRTASPAEGNDGEDESVTPKGSRLISRGEHQRASSFDSTPRVSAIRD